MRVLLYRFIIITYYFLYSDSLSDVENVLPNGKKRRPMSTYSASHCRRLKKAALSECSSSLSSLEEFGHIPLSIQTFNTKTEHFDVLHLETKDECDNGMGENLVDKALMTKDKHMISSMFVLCMCICFASVCDLVMNPGTCIMSYSLQSNKKYLSLAQHVALCRFNCVHVITVTDFIHAYNCVCLHIFKGGAYRDLSKVFPSMPSLNKVKTKVKQLNEYWTIVPTPNGTHGVQQSLRERLLLRIGHVIHYAPEDASFRYLIF